MNVAFGNRSSDRMALRAPLFHWLFATLWLSMVLVPALLTIFCALGQWRIPVDAAAVCLLLIAMRGRIGTWLLWTAYYLVIGLFILRCFNIDLGGLSFYAEFAGSIPPPKPALKAAAIFCLLMPFFGVRLKACAHACRSQIVVVALAALLAGSVLRMLPGAPTSLRYALPVPSLTMANSLLASLHTGQHRASQDRATARPGPLATAMAEAPPPDQIYLFTVESWADTPEGLTALAKQAHARYGDRLLDIRQGYRPSYGSTLQGELRELCDIERSVGKLSEVPFASCLPNRLKAMGYDEIAGHGYESMFYLRAALYPRLGFSRTFFFDDLKGSVPACHGAFPGLCDLNLLDRLLAASAAHRKRLVYQMTLQSHEPVGAEVLAQYGIDHAEINSTAVAHAFVAGGMARLATAGGADCGALIYFVGDHPPPSFKATGAASDEVSYLMLRLAPAPQCKT